MGNCKDNMKSSSDCKTGKDKKDAQITDLRKKPPEKLSPKASVTFADSVLEATDKLTILISEKEQELLSEKGREEYNAKALALLRLNHYMLSEVIENCDKYSRLK